MHDQVEASKLPERLATGYRAMFARGMNFRMHSAKEEKVTCDSGIASALLRACLGRGSENQGHFEPAGYIRWIEEILELEYQSHYCVVLVCAWVRAYPEREGASVIRDRYGFTLGNFENTMSLGTESFAFPGQCHQVFFSTITIAMRCTGGLESCVQNRCKRQAN
jgi:hypothetical protein